MMYDILAKITELEQRFQKGKERLNVGRLTQEIASLRIALEQQEYTPVIRAKHKLLKDKEALLSFWNTVESSLQGLLDIRELDHKDRELLMTDIKEQIDTVEKELEKAEKILYLSGPYDNNNAILEIHAGNGGDDAEDFVTILLRMYLRFSEKKKWKAVIVEENRSDVGIKSVVVHVEGDYAFGLLKNEKGNHKLYRRSPFKTTDSRQTSFAKVVITPIIEDAPITLKDEDLEISTSRSSGAGGQKVNKTDSAIRIRHIPSGITVHCQTERSQLQNKQQALAMLTSKIFHVEKEKQDAILHGIKGDVQNSGFGSHAIRIYIFDNPKKVRDYRTDVEMTDIQEVLDGHLDLFIDAALSQNK